MNRNASGHLAALVTILIWGTTFISTKLLLEAFEPVEILFFRFILGFGALLAACPRRLKGTTLRQEAVFAAAGLCGVCLYYLLENIALTCTTASNVGVIISIAPFFTAILTHLLTKQERLGRYFFLGFAVAMAGICLISFHGSKMQFNPIGDLLAAAAAAVWACYSVLTRKISSFGYHTVQTTRRVFSYGIVCMIPAFFLFDCHIGAERFLDPVCLGNLLFLGLGASALCFVTWNIAVKRLGAVKTSIYIYLVPVITVITSALVLEERVTLLSGIGTALTLIGLFLSEYRGRASK